MAANNLPIKHIPLDPFDSPTGYWHDDDGTKHKYTPCQRKAGSKDDRISKDKTYFAKIYGSWHMGKFSEVWYGWTFNNWGTSGCQLDSIEDLYEVDLEVL